jgi:urease subunit beta
MIPGELLIDEGEHPLNPGRRTLTLVVQNTGDRPIQVGSHYHFSRNQRRAGLRPRGRARHAPEHRLGTAVRFEPGQQRTVELVDYAGEPRCTAFAA